MGEAHTPEVLTAPQLRVLRLCDGIGAYADAFSGWERRIARALEARGLLFIAAGKIASLSDAGRAALSRSTSGGK